MGNNKKYTRDIVWEYKEFIADDFAEKAKAFAAEMEAKGYDTSLLFINNGYGVEYRKRRQLAKGGRITKDQATYIALYDGIDLRSDFHRLDSMQVARLIELAKQQGYQKPKNASGSRGRYFFYYLQKGLGEYAKGGEISLDKTLKSYIDTLGKEDLISMRNELGSELDEEILDKDKYKDELSYLNNKIGKYMYAKGGEINTISELYEVKKYEQYPYARDLVAHFIYGDDERGNLIVDATNGRYTNQLADYSELSDLMLGYENAWRDEGNMREIDGQVRDYFSEIDILDYYAKGGDLKSDFSKTKDYFGKELSLIEVYDENKLSNWDDDAQAMVEYYQRQGKKAMVIHSGDLHALYAEKSKSYAKGGNVGYSLSKPIKGESKIHKDNTHFAIHKPTKTIAFTWDYKGWDKDDLRDFKDDYFFVDIKDNIDVEKFKKSDFAIVKKANLEGKGIDLNNYQVFHGDSFGKGGSIVRKYARD